MINQNRGNVALHHKYVPNIQHLPGIIDGDIRGSFTWIKIACIRLETIMENTNTIRNVELM